MFSTEADDKLEHTLKIFDAIGSQANLLRVKFVHCDVSEACVRKLFLQCLDNNAGKIWDLGRWIKGNRLFLVERSEMLYLKKCLKEWCKKKNRSSSI